MTRRTNFRGTKHFSVLFCHLRRSISEILMCKEEVLGKLSARTDFWEKDGVYKIFTVLYGFYPYISWSPYTKQQQKSIQQQHQNRSFFSFIVTHSIQWWLYNILPSTSKWSTIIFRSKFLFSSNEFIRIRGSVSFVRGSFFSVVRLIHYPGIQFFGKQF